MSYRKSLSPSQIRQHTVGSHVNKSLTLQSINGISNDLQKLLKYFIGTAIFTLLLSVIRPDLYLNDVELLGIC